MITVPKQIVRQRMQKLIDKGYRPDGAVSELGVHVLSRKKKDGTIESQTVAFRTFGRDW